MLQHSAYLSKLKFWTVFLVLLFAVALLPAKPCQAGMQELADVDLSAVYAAGFSSFTWQTDGTQDIARANFNIETRMYAEIASVKMGYYNVGWDQNWSGVKLGASAADDGLLIAKDFYIEAGFDTATIDGATTRTLNYIKIGTSDLTGPISATFDSLSWQIGTALPNYRDNPNPGVTTTITASNTGFYMSLNSNSGYLVHWDNAVVTTP